MPRICYVERNFSRASLGVIEQLNQVVAEYAGRGFDLTVRQLYYQFVARDLFPEDRTWRWTGARWVRDPNGTPNATPNYKWLQGIVNDARLAGLLDWDTIVDRTRSLRELSHWESPADIVGACAKQYRVDKWQGQTYRPEVWIEKDALVGVIADVCKRLDVPYFSCRGYTSQSEVWGAARRLVEHRREGQRPHVLHLGDHDPSGLDMTRDIRERLRLFMLHHNCKPAGVERLALNMDQVEQYEPPPNPAKLTDSRCRAYIDRWGTESWELDALDPSVIANLVEKAVLGLRDEEPWEQKVEEERRARDLLSTVADFWPDIEADYGPGEEGE